jgi:RNAse (barnase) inhibitor barstar
MSNFIITDTIADYNTEEILSFTLDGKKCTTLEEFLELIAVELKFPNYYGHNLDAFDEMINDLSWLEQEAIVINIINFQHFIENDTSEDGDSKGLILSLLDQAADEQKIGKDGTPIKIMIKNEDDLEKYLDENGIEFLRK